MVDSSDSEEDRRPPRSAAERERYARAARKRSRTVLIKRLRRKAREEFDARWANAFHAMLWARPVAAEAGVQGHAAPSALEPPTPCAAGEHAHVAEESRRVAVGMGPGGRARALAEATGNTAMAMAAERYAQHAIGTEQPARKRHAPVRQGGTKRARSRGEAALRMVS